jgi:hypothetical protein
VKVEWGPVGVWAGAVSTFTAAQIALLASTDWFNRFRQPILRITFQPVEPWLRHVSTGSASALWVRVNVENVGRSTAHGCVGRLIGVTTSDAPRNDIDPLQLRWAGVPRSISIQPLTLRRGQHDYLNVLFCEGAMWRIDTFRDPDFDPGFPTVLPIDRRHRLEVAVFADNADPQILSITVDALDGSAEKPVVMPS